MIARRVFAPYCGPLCRAGLSTSETSSARHVPKQTGPKQTNQPGDSVEVTNINPNSVGTTTEQWTEVLDKTSGRRYYWNQQTSKPRPSKLPRVSHSQDFLHVQNRQSWNLSLFRLTSAQSLVRTIFSQGCQETYVLLVQTRQLQ